MIYSGNCFDVVTAIVWLVGIFVAISRRKLHPQVSTAVLTSLACMLASVIVQIVLFWFVLSSVNSRSMQTTMIFLGIAGFTNSLARAGGWAAILVAIFGWRNASDSGPNSRWSLQFSIRNLLVLTLVVAVICGLLQALVQVLGESAVVLFGLLDEVPTAICWVCGAWLAWSRRTQMPQVAGRVATAIGLSFASLLLAVCAFAYILTAGPSGGLVFVSIGFLSFLLTGPISWILLLTAAFGWRTTPAVTTGSPFRESPV